MRIKNNKIIGILWNHKQNYGPNYSGSFFTLLMKEFIQDKFYLDNALRTFIYSNKKVKIERSFVGNIYFMKIIIKSTLLRK